MVVSKNHISTKSFLLIFLTAELTILYARESYNRELCVKTEKEALLLFKQDLLDPSKRLSSWETEEDCCRWTGVICNNETGHVTALLLARTELEAPLKGKLSPSLLSLKYLTLLDLSHNDFGGIRIPSFLGSLASLRELELSNAGFGGMIPHQLGNLSSLRRLVINGDEDFSDLGAKSFVWISSLYSLEYLDLSYLDLSEASDWLLAFNKLHSLSELRLSTCRLGLALSLPLCMANCMLKIQSLPLCSSTCRRLQTQSLPSLNLTKLTILELQSNNLDNSLLPLIFNLSSLVHLDLSYNKLDGPFPDVSWSMISLRGLDVSHNYLSSAIPESLYGSNLENLNLGSNSFNGSLSSAIGNLSSIISLDFSENELQGNIPSTLGNLCNLETISLASNRFSSKVSEAFETLSGCASARLKSIDLGGNFFSGQITNVILQFENLRNLSLRGNMISGPIPEWLGKLSKLKSLILDRNKLIGSLPESLGSISSLEELVVSHNMLEGFVSEAHFVKLENLKTLHASGNSLTLRVDPDWVPPFRLSIIEIGSWKLGPRFPLWLKSQKDFELLDLSDAGISDTIPDWFWSLSFQFQRMNLSHNQLRGEIPEMLLCSDGSRIYLASNKLEGPLPRISSNLSVLDLSYNSFSGDIFSLLCQPINNGAKGSSLNVLLLGDNLLSGKIPDCWNHWRLLNWISLNNNDLTGEIPNSIGLLTELMSLHLRGNNLSGEIPPSLRKNSLLVILDMSRNNFSGIIPKWIGRSFLRLRFLSLHSNKLSGPIPIDICGLHRLRILILAKNNLSGILPSCFENIRPMATKIDMYPSTIFAIGDLLMDSAFVTMKGRDAAYGSILNLVTCLDISSNNLSGEIPREITSLIGLISLNLSRNNLNGSIPEEIGSMTWTESIDLSRNRLLGKLPPSMANLHFLNHLNVSNNNLSGEIPASTQLQSLDPSGFAGNKLCGPPLVVACRTSHKMAPKEEDDDGGEEFDRWFRWGIAAGFAIGFLGIIFPLIFSSVWRQAYFWFVGYIWCKVSNFCFNFKYIIINKFLGGTF